MGLLNSREMDDLETASDENIEADAELVTVLGLLIRSGQMRLLGGDRYFMRRSSNECQSTRVPTESDMEDFNKNDIAFQTRLASGVFTSPLNQRLQTITQLLNRREVGMQKGMSFSQSQKCRIANHKIPNELRVVDSYDHRVFCGIYSPDGTKLLTACQDRFLRLYDARSGPKFKQINTIAGRDVGWSILDVAFSPRSPNTIAYTSWSCNIHLLTLRDDDEELSHKGLPLCPEERRFCIFSLQFSSDEKDLLLGANDSKLYLYTIDSQACFAYDVESPGADVNAVAFADNTSQIVYSGGDDGLCKVWDRRTLRESSPKPVGVLAGHMQGVTYIDSRGDARYLISNSKDQSIKLWDIRMFSSRDAQESTKQIVSSTKWDYRWQEAPSNYRDDKKLKGDTSVATYKGHSVLQTLIRCHFSPAFSTGQRYIYTGDAYGKVIIYDVLTGKIVHELTGHTSCVRDVSWHPYRPEIVSSSWDFSVVCWCPTHALAETISAERSGEAEESLLDDCPQQECPSSPRNLLRSLDQCTRTRQAYRRQ